MPERGVYINRSRGKQLLRFDGFCYGSITPTDIDAVIEYRDELWITFEVKLEGKDVPVGQRLALERHVRDTEKAGKNSIAIIVEHDVYDYQQDVFLCDCIVRELYAYDKKTNSYIWRKPKKRITAKEAADTYIKFYSNLEGEQIMGRMKLTRAQIENIERTLADGDRVELVPVKDGARVYQVRRKEIKENTESPA